jgi:hypothetical protein
MTHTPHVLATLALLAAGCGQPSETDSGSEEVEPYAQMALHDGYWVTEVVTITAINDMHIDVETRRATVYAQAQALGQVVSPPQVGPGECTQLLSGETVCYHPNAVYLNGSGQELLEADGSGAWWVKHSWVVDGEGYENCTLMPPRETYDDCMPVEGIWLEDELSMRIGNLPVGPYNERRPLLDADPVAYEVVSFGLADSSADTGSATEEVLRLTFECVDEVSMFDGQTRPCPTAP